jgi:iron(III) transport system ATP-binding protein
MTHERIQLELRNITFGYQNAEPALKNLSLSINKGERIAVLGESGTGKSSLLRVISGLERILDGEIFFDGQLVAARGFHLPAEVRKVGMVFQDWAVFPHLSVRENIVFGLESRGKNPQDRQRAELMLSMFELNGFADRMPSTLSGGQLQRVACARALATAPRILLLDEAFSSLDVGLRQRIREQVIHVLESEQTTGILVTHDPAEAAHFAQRIFYLDCGVLSTSSNN